LNIIEKSKKKNEKKKLKPKIDKKKKKIEEEEEKIRVDSKTTVHEVVQLPLELIGGGRVTPSCCEATSDLKNSRGLLSHPY
jgi:F0F1-type ATP synthase assembly protein I